MQQATITFIGAGNMATSLISGLIANHYPVDKIIACNPSPEKLDRLNKQFGIHTYQDNQTGARQADVLILSVKPQVVPSVLKELKEILLERRPLVVSIAAGVRETYIRNRLSADIAIVRCMPNTPALVRTGAAALYANASVTEQQHMLAESILRSVGITLWLKDEKLLDVVTALSGSGPAYFFLTMEVLQQAAQQLGLDNESARLLTLQTALGAAKMALECDIDVASLRKQVTSPGGTTEAALNVLNQAGYQKIYDEALAAAVKRADELADLLSTE